jgi:hypothetical protein
MYTIFWISVIMLQTHITHWVQGQWRNKFLNTVRGIESVRVQKVNFETKLQYKEEM